jgi:Yqey-like protein
MAASQRLNVSTILCLFRCLEQPIVDIVAQEMKAAMKAKAASKLSTIRMIRTGFQNAAIELKTDTLSDEQVRKSKDHDAGFLLRALATQI